MYHPLTVQQMTLHRAQILINMGWCMLRRKRPTSKNTDMSSTTQLQWIQSLKKGTVFLARMAMPVPMVGWKTLSIAIVTTHKKLHSWCHFHSQCHSILQIQLVMECTQMEKLAIFKLVIHTTQFLSRKKWTQIHLTDISFVMETLCNGPYAHMYTFYSILQVRSVDECWIEFYPISKCYKLIQTTHEQRVANQPPPDTMLKWDTIHAKW